MPPASSHGSAARREGAALTRAAMSSAVNEAKMATTTDSVTSNGL